REYVLKQILYGIKDQYDAVIIDCMPSLGMITINALAASDEVLIPVEASYLPIKGLQQLLKTIGKVRKQINPKLQVGGILFTMVDAHTNDARNNMELLRNAYGSQIHIFDNYIPFSVRMKEAVREGQSIFSYDPKSKATEAYRRVTEEVLEDAI
ncbi:ParA family protein, partial [[Ruminococcus] lactaris]